MSKHQVQWSNLIAALIALSWFPTHAQAQSFCYTSFAESYSSGFMDYWTKIFRSTDNVVMFIVLVGIVCIGILMSSGRWKK